MPTIKKYLPFPSIVVKVVIAITAIITLTVNNNAQANISSVDKLAINNLNIHPWFSGAQNCQLDQHPAIESYRLNSDTYILRQNKCLHYEAPFIYLLFGEESALLIDTGATADAKTFPLAALVKEIMVQRAQQLSLPKSEIPLIVAHSHSHSDHVAGDSQFKHFNKVNMIKVNDTKALISALSFEQWPTKNSKIDLGQRVITIIPTPGHQAQALTFYDPQTSILLTGDSIYPGRLYIRQWQTYKDSIQRIIDFTKLHAVSAILGAHIEMSTTANVDYPVESSFHPNEASLVLKSDDLHKLNNQLIKLGDKPTRANLDNMIIFPVK